MLKNDYSKVIIPITIIILNLIVKGIFIATNSIGGDEPFSIYHAQMDVVSIINQLSAGNNPPLYEILLHFWIRLFGISEMAVRIPSLIFSTITVLFLYKIGKQFFNLRVAIYSSLFFIFSNYQIFFAHEARTYSLMAMFTTISMYFYLKFIVENITNKKTLIPLIFSNILLIYSHYFGFFVLFIQLIFILLNTDLLRKQWRLLLIIIGITIILYFPIIPTLINRFFDSVGNGTWLKSPNLGSIYSILRGFTNAPVLTSLTLVVLTISIIKYLIKYTSINTSIQSKFVATWFIFPFLFMFAISYWIPMFLDRYLIFTSIPFLLLLALAADFIFENNKYKFIVPSLLCILFIITTKPNITNKRNVRETVQKVKTFENDSTAIIICPYEFSLNFAYYYDIEIFKNVNVKNIYDNINADLKKKNIYSIYNISEFNIKEWNNVVFLDAAADFSYPNNGILIALEKEYDLQEKLEFYEIFKVYKFNLKNK